MLLNIPVFFSVLFGADFVGLCFPAGSIHGFSSDLVKAHHSGLKFFLCGICKASLFKPILIFGVYTDFRAFGSRGCSVEFCC